MNGLKLNNKRNIVFSLRKECDQSVKLDFLHMFFTLTYQNKRKKLDR